MLRFILFFFCVSAVWTPSLTKGTSKKIQLKDVGGRIFFGFEATLGQLPWQVYLEVTKERRRNVNFCGGSIISPEWIVTAAYCIDGATKAFVQAGEIELLVGIGNSANTFLVHEDYDSMTLANNIGLAKLTKPLKFNDNQRAIGIASEFLEPGVDITVSGWGLLYDGAPNLSAVLNYVTITTIDDFICKSFFGEEAIFDDMFCAFWLGNSIRSPCDGDTGGPAVTNPFTSNPVLVGIISFISDQGCESGYPSGYTRIAYHSDWIKNKTGI